MSTAFDDEPRLRLLLIEDSSADAVLVQRAVAAHWVEVSSIIDAKACLTNASFDAIVCDLMLVETSGTETIRGVRDIAPQTPLLILSGGVERSEAAALVGEGADAILGKEDLVDLRAAINLAVAQLTRLRGRAEFGGEHRLKRELFERATGDTEIFESLEGGILDGFWFWDLENDEEWHSPNLVESLGFTQGDAAFSASWWKERVLPADRELVTSNLEKLLSEPSNVFDYIVRYLHRDGGTVWLRCRGKLIHNSRGKSIRVFGCYSDVTALKEAEERLRQSALSDDLTGLPNSAALRQKCHDALLRTARSNQELALVYFDVDRFKLVNDQLGHDAGDAILQVVADRARVCVRELDVVGRLHGDEFVILAEGVGGAVGARLRAERLRRAIGQPVEIGDIMQPITISLGIALGPTGGANFEDLRDAADQAMLAAKRAGKNTIVLAPTQPRRRKGRTNSRIEEELWGALDRDELSLHYQPQRELANGSLVGYEALLRWTRRSGEQISPDIFVSMLEDIGVMPAVTAWSIEEVCRAITRVRVPVALNVSPAQLKRPSLIENLASALKSASFEPHLFELELTEPQAQIGEASSAMVELASLGVGLALDDFGKGHSSLERLERLPFTKIKLDQSLTFRSGELSRSVPAIVQLATDYGIALVAEGIETESQKDMLKRAGVAVGQGYWLSRPLPIEKLVTMKRADPRRRRRSASSSERSALETTK